MTTATASTAAPADLKLRENFRTGCVELRIGRKVVFSNREYRTTAEYAPLAALAAQPQASR